MFGGNSGKPFGGFGQGSAGAALGGQPAMAPAAFGGASAAQMAMT